MDGDEGTTARDLDRLATSLNVEWNALARGDAVRAAGIAAPFVDAARRLHALDAPPTLSPERRDCMWEEIMIAHDSLPRHFANSIESWTAPYPADRGERRRASALWSRPGLAYGATAALVAATLALGFFAVRSAGPPGDRLPVAGSFVSSLASTASGDTATAVAVEPLLRFTTNRLPTGFAWTGFDRITYAPGAADVVRTASGPDIVLMEAGRLAVSADGPVLVGRAANGTLPAPGITSPLVEERDPVVGPGDRLVVPAGRSYAFANATGDDNLTPASPAVFVSAVVMDASLSGEECPGVTWELLRSESGSKVPPAPAEVSIGRAVLEPGADLSAAPVGVLQVVAPAHATDRMLKVFADGSARNDGERALTVFVMTISPLAAGAASEVTPSP